MIRWVKYILKQCFGLPAPFIICMVFKTLMFQISLLNCTCFVMNLPLIDPELFLADLPREVLWEALLEVLWCGASWDASSIKSLEKKRRKNTKKTCPIYSTLNLKIFQLIFVWSKAWIRADLLGSPLASMTFAMSCSYSVPTLPVPPPAATVRW